MHRNYIGMLERGERMATLGAVKKLAKAIGTSMTALIRELEKSG